VSFLRIHQKEIYKSMDATSIPPKFISGNSLTSWENSIINFLRSEFPADFSTKETYEK